LPFLARSLASLGDALSRGGSDGDAAAAVVHRSRAHEVAQQLGMAGLHASLTLTIPTGEWALRRDGADCSHLLPNSSCGQLARR
jgi:hypothetical protein